MEINYFPYKGDKEDTEQHWAVDVLSILQRMSFFEEFGGSHSADKIAEHWYRLKTELLSISLQKVEKDGAKSEAKPKR